MAPDAATSLSSLLSHQPRRPQIYLLCQVADDIGEAAVRAALEHAGIVASQQQQQQDQVAKVNPTPLPPPGLPPQRLLFCETEVGKTSLVRQLEPELHIDGTPSTVR